MSSASDYEILCGKKKLIENQKGKAVPVTERGKIDEKPPHHQIIFLDHHQRHNFLSLATCNHILQSYPAVLK